MRLPRPPDWLVYGAGVALILFLALNQQERSDAPQAPPPVPGEDKVPLAASSPFAARVVQVPATIETVAGTAFSVGDGGVWITARHVIDGCRQSAIVVADGRGVAARLRSSQDDVAVLSTVGGSPALPINFLPATRRGQRAFMPGFPEGRPGEAASRLLGAQTVRKRGRGEKPQALLAWAEVGRTDGLTGSLSGLSGAPVLNAAGEVVGVTLAEAPRRGRIYTSSPDAIRRALNTAGIKPSAAVGEPISVDNYGRIADSLRRDLRVAQVVCLAT